MAYSGWLRFLATLSIVAPKRQHYRRNAAPAGPLCWGYSFMVTQRCWTRTVPQGLQVQALAIGRAHPRSLYVLPNGDVRRPRVLAPT